MHRLIKTILFLTLITACVNDELCVGNGTNEIQLKFVEYDSDPESVISITFDSIGVSGEPLAYPTFSDSTAFEIGLTVDPDSTWTRFVFITPTRTDTLDVNYFVTPSLISVQCGPELLYSKLDTLYNTFDSLAIIQETFDREVETNIKIYY